MIIQGWNPGQSKSMLTSTYSLSKGPLLHYQNLLAEEYVRAWISFNVLASVLFKQKMLAEASSRPIKHISGRNGKIIFMIPL
jgi:hypothetical protein